MKRQKDILINIFFLDG